MRTRRLVPYRLTLRMSGEDCPVYGTPRHDVQNQRQGNWGQALQSDESGDLVRQMVGFLYQALIEAEATEVVQAERHERTPSRTTQRNGSRPRLVSTKAGDVELKIPKLRKGSFFPSVLERRRRIDQALYAVVMEAYVHGVSTRKVDDLVSALGVDAGISKSEVSRICAALDEQMNEFRSRPLSHLAFPYLLWPDLRQVSAYVLICRNKYRLICRSVPAD